MISDDQYAFDPTRIYLTGFMGCGKTTLAPMIARLMDYVWTDVDRNVERNSKMSIAEIFEQEGEEGFRERESAELEKTTALSRVVIALGGGAVLHKPSLRLVHGAGRVVYLRASVDSLARRLHPTAATRPMLWDASGEERKGPDLKRHIAGLLAEREPTYIKAAHVMVNANGSPGQVAGRAVRALYARYEP